MNITLIGSGTRSYGMSDAKGIIPWLHWAIFRNFLLQHIHGRSILIGSDSFQDVFFQEFLLAACAKITVLHNGEVGKDSRVFASKDLSVALASATDSTPNIWVIGDDQLPISIVQEATEIRYLQIGMNISASSLCFPKIDTQRFRQVSWIDSKEEIWLMNHARFGTDPQRQVSPIQVQHWMRKVRPS